MNIVNTDTNKSNRRHSFRIYDQVNLFFHKIEHDEIGDAKLNFNNSTDNVTQSLEKNLPSSKTSSSPDDFLPDSHSQENDTLNVNISASGISFTCKEELVPGDYLMLRVLLLSSMTVITTYCKVVHFKPSNPYEKKRYPYLVGARFVNLKQEEKKLLDKHVNKKRTQHFLADGLIASLIITMLLIPDVILDVLTQLGSFVLENTIETIHLLYEVFELSMDHAIEHTFHTGLHDTQIIVFYIQIVLGIFGLFILFRIILSAYRSFVHNSSLYFHRKKLSFLYYWGEKSILYKIGVFSTGIIAILCYGLFFI